MALQSVTIHSVNATDPFTYANVPSKGRGRGGAGVSPVNVPADGRSASATLSAEYYHSDKLFLEFQSKDGDKVTLDLEHVEYQKSLMAADVKGGNGLSDEQWQKIVEKIRDDFVKLQEHLIKRFVDSLDGKVEADGEDEKTGEVEEDQEVAEVPEYWNAENTSQRIVDFALQFADAFEGGDEEFLQIIKDAIDEGFKQAGDIMGELPDSVRNLVNNTHDLVMKKLDDWLAQRTAAAADEQPAVEQTV